MLTMTDNAAEAVRLISAGSGLEPEPGLRISAGPTSDAGTQLEISITAEPADGDQTIEEGGARVYLDEPNDLPEAALRVAAIEIVDVDPPVDRNCRHRQISAVRVARHNHWISPRQPAVVRDRSDDLRRLDRTVCGQ